MLKPFIVGLTGGIGSGKTTVANLFADKGITLVDADIVARQVVEPQSPGLQQIKQHFGEHICNTDGSLNRAELRNIIFADDKELQWLNNLLHPLIRQTMLQQVAQATSAYVIMVVPLLFENGLDRLVNKTLVVDVAPEIQISRTSQRDNVPDSQVEQIITSQISRKDRLAKADDVIDNQGDLADLTVSVEALHNQYLKLAQQTL
ncbi:dephospho-CoA kinase [Shewanella gaetbuli]